LEFITCAISHSTKIEWQRFKECYTNGLISGPVKRHSGAILGNITAAVKQRKI
jgi:hypothetical protein